MTHAETDGMNDGAVDPTKPLVLVVVGTDHHRFDRVVQWVDTWLAGRPVDAGVVDVVDVVVQHGTSAPPVRARGHALVPHAELQDLMARATVVVTHGGPATIAEVRRRGRVPVVVPRDPGRGEHVDSHQQLFSRRMAAAGRVRLCERREDLVAALDAGLADPAAGRVHGDDDARQVAEAVARVGAVVDEVVAASRSRRRR